MKSKVNSNSGAFSLVEFSLVLLITALIISTVGPAYFNLIDEAKTEETEESIEGHAQKIDDFYNINGNYPDSLEEVFSPVPLDPWGNPYQYLRINGGSIKGKGNQRKDKNLVPINSDYDFYSMGPDGKSVPPLTANDSKDDIVRGQNGGYFGPASEY